MANRRSASPSPPTAAEPSPASRSSRPPRLAARLDEALADAEKMARRVDEVLDDDPFAAAILAREYLSLVTTRDVDPLNQQGSTDAWTSAFVRLRVAGNALAKHPRRADGEAYLTARAEERRLSALFGTTPRARVTAGRAEVRTKRLQARALRIASAVALAFAIGAFGIAFALGHVHVAIAGATGGVLVAAAALVAASFAARAHQAAARRAADLEGEMTALALFDSSEGGRRLLDRIRKEHPLLARTSLGSTSSAPPPRSQTVRASRRP